LVYGAVGQDVGVEVTHQGDTEWCHGLGVRVYGKRPIEN
jgi:hypothetical protein